MANEMSWFKFLNQIVLKSTEHGLFAMLFLALLAGGAWHMYHIQTRMNELQDYFREEFAVVVLDTREVISENTEVLRQTQNLLRTLQFREDTDYSEGIMKRRWVIRVARFDGGIADKEVFADTELEALREVKQTEDYADVATGMVTFTIVPVSHQQAEEVENGEVR